MLAISDIYVGGTPDTRNQELQKILRMIGYGDNIGSGFPAILDAWKEKRWRLPYLRENTARHTTDLELWMLADMPESASQALNVQFPASFASLDDASKFVVVSASVENSLTPERVAALLNINHHEAHVMLDRIAAAGILANIPDTDRWIVRELPHDMDSPAQLGETVSKCPMCDLHGTDLAILQLVRSHTQIIARDVIENTTITSIAGAGVALRRLMSSGHLDRKRAGREYLYFERSTK